MLDRVQNQEQHSASRPRASATLKVYLDLKIAVSPPSGKERACGLGPVRLPLSRGWRDCCYWSHELEQVFGDGLGGGWPSWVVPNRWPVCVVLDGAADECHAQAQACVSDVPCQGAWMRGGESTARTTRAGRGLRRRDDG